MISYKDCSLIIILILSTIYIYNLNNVKLIFILLTKIIIVYIKVFII